MGINSQKTYYQLSKTPANITLTEAGIAAYEKIYRKTAKKAPFEITEADIQRDMAIVCETKGISGPLGGIAANLGADFLMNPLYVTSIIDGETQKTVTLTIEMVKMLTIKEVGKALMANIPQGPIGNNE